MEGTSNGGVDAELLFSGVRASVEKMRTVMELMVVRAAQQYDC